MMKKRIEAELIKVAEKILREKGKMNLAQLKKNTIDLYEKLALLDFTEKHLSEIADEEVVKEEKTVQKKEKPKEEAISYDEFYPDGTEYNEDSESITEPNTEKIKDIVAQMPPETEKVDTMINKINTPETQKKPQKEGKDFRQIGVDYDNLPDFEPVNHVEKTNKPRSLNDRLKKGINIGLNERLSYIRHLFDGNTSDYNRVLSQLNTFNSLEEAKKFIDKIVKPDYNNWEGKEDYAERFMEHIENKFSK